MKIEFKITISILVVMFAIYIIVTISQFLSGVEMTWDMIRESLLLFLAALGVAGVLIGLIFLLGKWVFSDL